MQCSGVQWSALHCSAVECSAVQCSAVERKKKEKKKKEEREKEKEKKKELADMNRKYIAKLKLIQKLKLALADAEKETVELGGKFVEMGEPLPELPSESSESSEAAASEDAAS